MAEHFISKLYLFLPLFAAVLDEFTTQCTSGYLKKKKKKNVCVFKCFLFCLCFELILDYGLAVTILKIILNLYQNKGILEILILKSSPLATIAIAKT